MTKHIIFQNRKLSQKVLVIAPAEAALIPAAIALTPAEAATPLVEAAIPPTVA